MRGRLAGLVVAAFVSLVLPGPRMSAARLLDSDTTSLNMTTDTLDPPTGLAAAGGSRASLTWTPTADAYASGYQVLRSSTSGSGHSQVATATPRSASSYNDTPTLDGTYYYVLRSYIGSWTSAQTSEVNATVKVGDTGAKPCTAQAADVGGDNNGFEGSSANGCALDGLLATDMNTGTNTSTTCTDAGKDKHQFSLFALGLPATVTSVNGITVRARVGEDATSGTNRICAQLSWNSGVSWTAAQQVTVTATAQTTYTLGGATTLWGRTWTAAQFSDVNFRVRLISVSSVTTRDYSLDGVTVEVNYTP